MKKEVWVPVYKYEGIYEVSNLGEVRSVTRYVWVPKRKIFRIKRGALLHPQISDRGYRRVRLSKNGRTSASMDVAKIVAQSFLGPHPGKVVDHKNRIKTDDSLVNLRWCSQKQNVVNRSIGKNNTSGVTGVSWDKSTNKWTASIKNICLGKFKSKDAAISIRRAAEKKHFGEFAPNHDVIGG